MSAMSSIGFAIVASLPTITGTVGEKFEPQILAERDNGFVVEVVISCPQKVAGIMHYDKITGVYTDSKSLAHKSAASAYASTCGLNSRYIAQR